MKHRLYPLSIPQKTILATEEYFPGDIFNHNGGIIVLKKRASVQKIDSAINRFIENHDIFRMMLTLKDGEYYQYIEEYKPEVISWFDFNGRPEEFNAWIVFKRKQRIFYCNRFLYDNCVVVLPTGEIGIYLVCHHIIADGYSIVKYCTDIIGEIYDLNVKQEEKYYYTKYIEKEELYLNSSSLKKDKIYWDEKISQYEGEAYYKGTYSQNLKCRNTLFNIGTELTDQINLFCSEYKVSVYNLFMAALVFYKSVLTRNKSVSIGTSLLNRMNTYQMKTMGMFANTLPFFVNIDNRWSIIEFINKIRNETMELLRHQRYEYQKIREKYNETTGDLQNLLEITLTYLNAKVDHHIDNSLYQLDMFRNDRYTTPFIMSVMDLEGKGSIEIEYKLQMEKVSEEETSLIHYRLLNILKQFMTKSKESISKVNVLDTDEQNYIMEQFNNTNAIYPNSLCIHQIFEEQVQKTPMSTAVKFGKEEITYIRLNQKANQLARHLRKENVGVDDFVAIICDRSIEMIIAIYAVLKAGAAYVPMDPEYPMERIEYQLQDCDAKVVLVGHKNLNLRTDIQWIDLFDGNNYMGEDENLVCINKPKDLIYLIYTSGTTGKPKGVMLEHRNVVRLLKNDRFQFNFSDEDVWTMFHSFCFDFSVWEIYGATLFGGKLVIVSKEESQDTFQLLEILERERVTVLNQVPSSFYNLMMVDQGMKELSLRYLIFGGEALNPSRLVKWCDMHPEVHIINMYGITETTVHVTYRKIGEKEINKGISDIGTPIPTLKLYILSGNQLCGVGMPGELCVAGAGLARGYYKREDLTKQKFVENPFVKGQRLYRSGDLARWLPDGNVEYLGRIDEQVKVRGFRIELGEIDSVIRKQKGIKDVAVITKNNETMEKQICAYIVGEEKTDIQQLKEEIRNELPDYMVPMFITQVEKIPTNVNGKLDKKGLLNLKIINETNYIAPTSELEQTLAAIYEEVLEVTQIGITDNFYEHGGDSIKAIRIVSNIRKLGYDLNVKEFMFSGDIQKVAKLMQQKKQKNNSRESSFSLKAIPQDNSVENHYPVSAAQKRIYLASQTEGAVEGYIMLGAIKISGSLNEILMEESFQILVSQNEILRTTFDIIDNKIVQVIHPKIDFKLDRINIDAENAECFYKRVAYQAKDFIKPFSLEHAPLLRVYYAKYDNDNCVLIVDIHHIISDGITLGIIVKEVANIYSQLQKQLPMTEEKKLQYKEFTMWHNEYLKSKEVMKQKQYWLNRFKTLPASLYIPTDYLRQNKISYDGNKVSELIDSSLIKQIQEVIQHENITQYIFLLAAYQVLLAHYTQQSDIVIGSPSQGRGQLELDNMMGVFVNMLPMRNTIDFNVSFKQLIKQVKINAIEAYENQDYPFDDLVQNLNIKRDTSRNPLFNIAFSMENFDIQDFVIDEVSMKQFNLDYDVCRFELTLFVTTSQPQWQVTIKYQTALYKKNTVQKLLDNYISIMNQIVVNPDILIGNIHVDTNLISAKTDLNVGQEFNFSF